jgi:hypothetical protein
MTATTFLFVYLTGIPFVWSALAVWKPGVVWWERADPALCLAKAILWPLILSLFFLRLFWALLIRILSALFDRG